MDPEDVTFQVLREITNDFSKERKIGQGSFGEVYKGVTKNGEDVAVKMLFKHNENVDDKQFRNEFHNMTLLKHKNIVQVIGYCYETKQVYIVHDGRTVLGEETRTALCLEYLQNGSLKKHLSDEFGGLDWLTRYKIIKGTCEGIKYIHEDLKPPIYHFDLKPDNILLDEDMEPKISDFGLSKIFGEELTRTTQSPLGTLGFVPPEYINKGEISKMFDIFSLGVIMIQIVSGLEGHSKQAYMPKDKFIDLVKTNWRNRLQETWSDSSLEAYCLQVETCTHIALNCMEDDSQKRQNIVEIINKLNAIEIVIGKLPKRGKTISEMTMYEKPKKIRKEPRQLTGQLQNINEQESFDARETSMNVEEKLIVGRTAEKNKTVASLLESLKQKITILPIYGIGGIGKTTFARMIYNDANFKCYSQVWVDVSQRFDLNKIGKSIISQLSAKESPENERRAKESPENERRMICSCLTKLLSGKKIMMVLDDLWEENQFRLQDLKDMLHHDDSNIIILVTTRSECVAERICANLEPYKILPLTDDMCWDIIKQRSCFEARDDKEQLMDIGREIAQKCGGVALAALSLGFTLRSMNFDQWMKVKDSDIWNEPVSKDFSLPNHALASLKLSYINMCPCLKTCFTFCATFPKGHKIVKDNLIYQWISLDFIKPTKLHSNMQLSKKYIEQLLGMSFFQRSVPSKTAVVYHEDVTLFTMHDLVHDLAKSFLADKILDPSKQGKAGGSNYIYALLTDCSRPLVQSTASPYTLRALSFLECGETELSGAAFLSARYLCVLDLSECCIKKLPDSIGQLEELRYLNAPGIQHQSIPNSITNLSKLIYLNIRESSEIRALPLEIGEMEHLTYLDLSGCDTIDELPKSFGKLRSIVHLDLSRCSLNIVEGVPEALKDLTKLQYLNLSTHYSFKHEHCETLRGLQDVLGSLTELCYLNLKQCLDYMFSCEQVEEINRFLGLICTLSNLEHLDLSYNYHIYNLPETIGRLRNLHTLNLSGCRKLQRLPASILEIGSLKFLNTANCDKLDKSTIPQFNNTSILFPQFVVRATEGEFSSSLVQLENENPPILEISKLENVKSAEEPQIIKLRDKKMMEDLTFVWTRDAKRFMEDRELLKELVPADTLTKWEIKGYSSITFPCWVMDIAQYLPNLVRIFITELPRCTTLPPLGQLRNLEWLRLEGMDSISKIDGYLYGGADAFPHLKSLQLFDLKNLEEWNMTYTSLENDTTVLVFCNLSSVYIKNCPNLRLKPCPPRATCDYVHWQIDSSDAVMSSWEESGQVGEYKCKVTHLEVENCEVPLHKWRLVQHLSALERLTIRGCSDLTSSSPDVVKGLSSLGFLTVEDCETFESLPDWLGELRSLETLSINKCGSFKAVPDSIRRLILTLEIDGEQLELDMDSGSDQAIDGDDEMESD